MRRTLRLRLRIANLNSSYFINERLIKRVVAHIFRFLGNERLTVDLGFIFLSDRQITEYNKKYKGENRATDVLSFDLTDPGNPAALLGEVFISIDSAVKNSRIFRTIFQEEFVLYIIHGILHLTGYDDRTRGLSRKMESKQGEILKYLCTREDLSKVLTRR
ncbi:MAG: rRNA maturation RNase YbeY [Candidatus Omnitrophica bacterium]|nr:rRNA maturation RNase YbeY [Candidatus Omnitrophota bacterium]